MNMKKTTLRFLIPLAVTGGILYLFFRDISLSDIALNFRKIPAVLLIGFVMLSLAATLLRAIRYHILLSGKLRFWDMILITLVRNFSVDLLPARTAALLFYSYLTRKKGIALEEGASSFVVAVFYDGLALSFMLGGLLFFVSTSTSLAAVYLGLAVLLGLSVLVVFFSDVFLGWFLRLKPVRRFKKLHDFLLNVLNYLRDHKRYSERLKVFALSLLIRLFKYVFIYLLFEGVVGIGWSMKHFSLFCFGLAGAELSSLLPIQGLGGFGTWELAFAMVFQALALPAANIREAGFVIHITTQAWEYAIGLAAFLVMMAGKTPREKPEGNTGGTS
jgi:uncharacterized membrane protein YbhN (UPF0104 family)